MNVELLAVARVCGDVEISQMWRSVKCETIGFVHWTASVLTVALNFGGSLTLPAGTGYRLTIHQDVT